LDASVCFILSSFRKTHKTLEIIAERLEKGMSILKGTCIRCGTIYYGWALEEPLKRICVKCGNPIAITEDNSASRVYDNVELSAKNGAKRTRDLEITSSG
jgi:hypothetical protein